MKYAFVAEFAGVKTRVRSLAFWGGGHFMDNVEYDLDGTPCEAVLASVGFMDLPLELPRVTSTIWTSTKG